MNPIKFLDHKDSILEALNKKKHGILEPTTLIDGFFNQPIYNEVSGNVIIGGPMIPMVAVVGKESGRIYYFALKVLLPNITL